MVQEVPLHYVNSLITSTEKQKIVAFFTMRLKSPVKFSYPFLRIPQILSLCANLSRVQKIKLGNPSFIHCDLFVLALA